MTQQGPDLIGEFQRWLIRSSTRGVGRQVTGQIRSAFGRNQPTGDVWQSATADPTPEAPECAWCPLCRAARVLRESKPGRDTRVTAVSDALGTVVQDAFSVLEAALATTGRVATGDGQRSGTAGQAAKASSSTAGRETAGEPAKSKNGAASRSATGQAAGAKRAHTGHGPDGKEGTARRKAGDKPAAEHGPAGQHGTAAPAASQEPAPEPPVGSPDEPDDRG